MSNFEHGVTFDLHSARTHLHMPYLRHISPIIKLYGLLQLFITCIFYLAQLSPLAAILQLIILCYLGIELSSLNLSPNLHLLSLRF